MIGDYIQYRVKSNAYFSKIVSEAYLSYLKLKVSIHQRYAIKSFRKEIPAIKIMNIKPSDVEFKMPRWGELFWDTQPGSILGGEWDVCLPRYVESDLYLGFRSHFEEGVPWEETTYYRQLVDELNKTSWHGAKTPDEVITKLKKYDELYDEIKQNGYKSQRELRANRVSNRLKPPELCEVLINVGRDGDIILDDGRHRFTIAHILGIQSIPACVIAWHAESLNCNK